MPRLIIRADASPSMGTGHVMRCLALAQAAIKAGFEVNMICRISVEWLIKRLSKEKIRLHILRDLLPKEENPNDLLAQLQIVDLPQQDITNQAIWVVLDGYHFTSNCHKAIMDLGYKLLIIDDYNHLPEYCCDILLNQNIGAEQFAYSGKIGKKLLGIEHVLLRQEFLDARKIAKKRILPVKVKEILISLGGGNFIKHLEPIAKTMTMPELEGCIISIIQGGMDDKKLICSYFVDCPAKIKILEHIEDVPALFLNTDLCIAAGGSTCWELCYLGVPFLTVEIAENQKKIVAGLYDTFGISPYSKESLLTMLKEDKNTTIQNIPLIDESWLAPVLKEMYLGQK